MQYKGKELTEITKPQFFNPPKRMVVWHNTSPSDGPCERLVCAIVTDHKGATYVIARQIASISGVAIWRHCAEIPDDVIPSGFLEYHLPLNMTCCLSENTLDYLTKVLDTKGARFNGSRMLRGKVSESSYGRQKKLKSHDTYDIVLYAEPEDYEKLSGCHIELRNCSIVEAPASTDEFIGYTLSGEPTIIVSSGFGYSKDTLATNREVAKWLSQGNGEYTWVHNDDIRHHFFGGNSYVHGHDDEQVEEHMRVRKWDDTEWVRPTRAYLGLED